MNIPYPNWQAVFFDFLVGGVIILSIFRVIQFILPVFLTRSRRYRSILKSFPIIETVVWVLYLSWYTFRFAEIRSVYAFVVIALLLVLFFWISRFFIKELVAGIIFKASGKFREGEVIIHGSIKGSIKRFGLQSIEVESQDGQIIYIPYSTLADSPAIKHESTEKSAAFTFSLTVKAELPREDTATNIRHYLLSLPWSSSQKAPLAVVREQVEDQYQVEVTAYPIEKAFGKKIEQICRQKFGLKV